MINRRMPIVKKQIKESVLKFTLKEYDNRINTICKRIWITLGV